MESAASKAVRWLLRLSGVKALTEWTDGDILSWIIEKDLIWDAEIPARLLDRYQVAECRRADEHYFRFFADAGKSNRDYIFYVHGGGFIIEMYFLYWLFVERLIEATRAEVMVPIYPLYPQSDFDGAYRHVRACYHKWRELLAPNARIHLVSDSSGCALALRLAQELAGCGRSPMHCVLISPWVDMNVRGNVRAPYAEKDPFVSPQALRSCALNVVPADQLGSPEYSPLFGELRGIQGLTVFAGTADTLYPDALALRRQAEKQHVEIYYYEHQNMFHIYPHFPAVPEGMAAFEALIALLMPERVQYNVWQQGKTIICGK